MALLEKETLNTEELRAIVHGNGTADGNGHKPDIAGPPVGESSAPPPQEKPPAA
jgi:hypothetical protein